MHATNGFKRLISTKLWFIEATKFGSIRFSSNYVKRIKVLNTWIESDAALGVHLPIANYALMIDRRPLVSYNEANKKMSLQIMEYSKLNPKLEEYGFKISIKDSILLDALEDPDYDYKPLLGLALHSARMPEDSPITVDKILEELGRSLVGFFFHTRKAMMVLDSEYERNLLSKMHALSEWSESFKRCPKCASVVETRVSKTSAYCVCCQSVFYPPVYPVAICLITNRENTQCLLVHLRRSFDTVYTAIAGFAQNGESLVETVRREVAEEVGIECTDVVHLNMTQSWPSPEGSIMCAFHAIADPTQKLDICREEVEVASWFSRDEVQRAYENTLRNPLLKNVKRNDGEKHLFRHVAPTGAIANQMIKAWLDGKF